MARMRGFSTLLRGIRAMDLVVFGICCASFLFGADLAVASFGHDVSSNSPRAGAGLAPLLSQHAGTPLAQRCTGQRGTPLPRSIDGFYLKRLLLPSLNLYAGYTLVCDIFLRYCTYLHTPC
eukprot:GHVT01005098.1.p2 GENE.GHVT01005098.1~~GHVT01005098.1.p2  ORF type:complete len:121 (+),score=6.23 GHVT01005098.1:450-812(+)